MDPELLTIAAGAVLGPLITALLKRVPAIQDSGNDGLGAAINAAVCVLGCILTGAILPRLYPELPHDFATWVKAGLAAAGLGGAGNNIWRKKISPPKETP